MCYRFLIFGTAIGLGPSGRSADLCRRFRYLIASLPLGSALAVVLTYVACGSPSGSDSRQAETTSPPPHQVVLSWEASASQDVIGYYVYRSLQPGGPYSRLNVQALDDTEYTDTAVTASTTYYYVVSSVAENGLQSVYSNEAAATVPSP